MANLSRKFSSDAWSLDYDMLAKGGLVIGNVMHDNYNLAKDLRVVRIWINPDDENPLNVKSFYLGTDQFDDITVTSEPLKYIRYTNLNAPPPFDIYTKANKLSPEGLQAVYRSKQKVFENPYDNDDDFLTITQTYIFTPYGNNPAHEPGGVLPATRVFPLIKFHYGGKKVKSIRIDYRINACLDFFLRMPNGGEAMDSQLANHPQYDNISSAEVDQIRKNRPNMGGIFRDNEGSPPLTALYHPTSDEIFNAYEKPIQYEVCGFGLIKGYSGHVHADNTPTQSPTGGDYFLKAVDRTTWDNYHQWSGYKDIKKVPSAPGAFHCFHLHWRWNYLSQHPDNLDKGQIYVGNSILATAGTGAVGADQFQGVFAQADRGGALLDSKIPNQTIRFAVTKPESTYTNVSWDANENPSNQNFEDLFYDVGYETIKPRKIKDGNDLIFWLSFQVHNEPRENINPVPASGAGPTDNGGDTTPSPFEGTVFIHGLYFAHNFEDYENNPFGSTIGQTGNKPERTTYHWHRDAE